MKLKDVELLPGVIINVDDPKMQGRVKAVVPTLFDSSTMNVEGLPWIYPISMGGNQTFSKMMNGSKIWVFKQENNYREFWYMPMFELNGNTKEIVSNYNEPDILISRTAGEESIYIYYNDTDGLKLQIGDAVVNITPDKTININAGESKINIENSGTISIGKGDSFEHQAVLSKPLKYILEGISNGLTQCASLCTGECAALVPGFNACKSAITENINNLFSENIKIN